MSGDKSAGAESTVLSGTGPSPEQFSLLDPEVQSEPWAFYKAMQDRCPVYRIPERGFYLISRYEDLDQVLRNPVDFSNMIERGRAVQGDNIAIVDDILRERGWEHVPTLQRTDPPQHTRYRKIVDATFNMRQVRNVEPHVVEVVNQLIDRFIDRGECEFVDEFALPLPGTVVAELIGLDARDWRTFKMWSDNLMSYATQVKTPQELSACAEIEMQHFLMRTFDDRRSNPREDLMTGLVTAYEGIEPLTPHELLSFIQQLMAGGFSTTTSALSHGMWQMIRFPEVAAEVRADRSLMRAFINESLRFESPVQGLYRTATRDIELNGTLIPKGSLCQVRYGAANRDPRMFPEPARFDIHRSNAALHLGFGAPPHFCPGAALARTQLAAAYNAILDRLDDFELARPLPHPVHESSTGNIPLKALWMKFIKRGT